MSGLGSTQIARELTEREIIVPSVHMRNKGVNIAARTPSTPYAWQGRTVANILERQEYLGHTINFKTRKQSYKTNKKIWNDPEDCVVFKNTHESIIDEESWLIVQKIREGKCRPAKFGPMSVLSGMMFCSDCGAKLYQVRGKRIPTHLEYFVCATYRKHTEISTISPELIREFVDKIIVYQAQKVNGKQEQRIKIYYNCIGAIENIPSE